MSRRYRAFTLIELITVIVILGILSAVALPVFLDYRSDANMSSCKGVLGAVRAAIANYYAHSATTSGGGVQTYPALTDLNTVGNVMTDTIGDNPYTSGSPKNTVAASAAAKGTVSGSAGGWLYNVANGQFWANTNTSGVGENNF